MFSRFELKDGLGCSERMTHWQVPGTLKTWPPSLCHSNCRLLDDCHLDDSCLLCISPHLLVSSQGVGRQSSVVTDLSKFGRRSKTRSEVWSSVFRNRSFVFQHSIASSLHPYDGEIDCRNTNTGVRMRVQRFLFNFKYMANMSLTHLLPISHNLLIWASL